LLIRADEEVHWLYLTLLQETLNKTIFFMQVQQYLKTAIEITAVGSQQHLLALFTWRNYCKVGKRVNNFVQFYDFAVEFKVVRTHIVQLLTTFFIYFQRLNFAELRKAKGKSQSAIVRAVLRISLVVDLNLWKTEWNFECFYCQMNLLLLFSRNQLDILWDYLCPEAIIMNDSNRKVNEVVPMGSDKESALESLIVALGHASNFNLICLVHQTLQLQQALPESTTLDPL
jgi:hypothetical protein